MLVDTLHSMVEFVELEV